LSATAVLFDRANFSFGDAADGPRTCICQAAQNSLLGSLSSGHFLFKIQGAIYAGYSDKRLIFFG